MVPEGRAVARGEKIQAKSFVVGGEVVGLLGKGGQNSGSDMQPRTEPNTPKNLKLSRTSNSIQRGC